MTTPVEDSSRRPALRAGDVVLAGSVAVLLSAVITVSQAGTGTAPSPIAYLFAVGFGALQLLRRPLPVAMLVLSALGTFAYYTLDLPTIGVALPVVAALFSAAEQGVLRWSIGTGAVVFAVALGFRLRDDPQPLGYLLGTDALTNLALIAAGIALGAAVRAHRLQIAQREQISRLQEERTRREAQLRMREERERISRELHDTVGHALAVISLHSGVARDAVGQDDAAAVRALEQVREQAGDSLQELRGMVRLLRTPGTQETQGLHEAPGSRGTQGSRGAQAMPGGADIDPGAPPPRHVRSFADVPALTATARAAGLAVEEQVDVPPGTLSHAADSAAYRIVQESVTNVLKHAEASRLRVSARLDAERLRIVVADDGRGSAQTTGGVGLDGMRERVRLLGGTLAICTSPSDGFTIEVSMPARPAAAEERPSATAPAGGTGS
ncbi:MULTISPECIES: sensor histidine kinase [Brachybacterium]|uniref:sensor histidine kinase n=1 Tax=Brachybacterium TaxID=43668 RepID=UPI000DF44FD3|nr:MULTISPECIES: sensor histidine kinase [Brachybacterium]RCS65616.1 sensor histidine kinase [Brachybacterium sp. JB7]RCS78507.1 sensor histidine kinase [Brachybacterium alimentarium]